MIIFSLKSFRYKEYTITTRYTSFYEHTITMPYVSFLSEQLNKCLNKYKLLSHINIATTLGESRTEKQIIK